MSLRAAMPHKIDCFWPDEICTCDAEAQGLRGALRYYEGLIRMHCDDKILKLRVLDEALGSVCDPDK